MDSETVRAAILLLSAIHIYLMLHLLKILYNKFHGTHILFTKNFLFLDEFYHDFYEIFRFVEVNHSLIMTNLVSI